MAYTRKTARTGSALGRVIKEHVTVDLHPLRDTAEGMPKNWGLFRNTIASAFQAIFGLPPALLRKEHRDMLEESCADAYPVFRKSAARMFMEGMLTDGVTPLSTVPTGSMKRLETALQFLDMLETMVYQVGAQRLMELDVKSLPNTPYRALIAGHRVGMKTAKKLLAENNIKVDPHTSAIDSLKAAAEAGKVDLSEIQPGAKTRAEKRAAAEAQESEPSIDDVLADGQGFDLDMELVNDDGGSVDDADEQDEIDRLVGELENE